MLHQPCTGQVSLREFVKQYICLDLNHIDIKQHYVLFYYPKMTASNHCDGTASCNRVNGGHSAPHHLLALALQ